nr:MAG TPA: hypothetical protein [Caudoviricetes sp.]
MTVEVETERCSAIAVMDSFSISIRAIFWLRMTEI